MEAKNANINTKRLNQAIFNTHYFSYDQKLKTPFRFSLSI